MASIRPVVNQWSALFADVLIAAGGTISARDRLGRTPLHVACFLGNQHAATTILNASGDAHSELLGAVDAAGNTAMDLALLNGFAGTARMLKERWGATASRNTHAILDRMRNKVHAEDDAETSGGSSSDGATALDATGGWGEATPVGNGVDGQRIRNNASGVDMRESLDWPVFAAEHLIPRRPVLFRGGCANWTAFRRVLTRSHFIDAFGARTLSFARCVDRECSFSHLCITISFLFLMFFSTHCTQATMTL